MSTPVLYKITYDQFIDLINDPMRNVRFHYEDATLIPSHLSFKNENEMTMFLLGWSPVERTSFNKQALGRVLRYTDSDINSLYAHTITPLNIHKEK